MTVAILVAKNRTGYDMAEELRKCGAEFDERLQTSRSSRRVTDALASALEFVGTPLKSANLDAVFQALNETVSPPTSDERQGEDGSDAEPAHSPETAESISRLLRSCYRPETLLYPRDGEHMEDALPRVGDIGQTQLAAIGALAKLLRSWLEASTLPIDQFAMTMAQDVVVEAQLPRAQQVAAYLRRKKEQDPLLRRLSPPADCRCPRTTQGIRQGRQHPPLPGGALSLGCLQPASQSSSHNTNPRRCLAMHIHLSGDRH